jgi:hypothetical protein
VARQCGSAVDRAGMARRWAKDRQQGRREGSDSEGWVGGRRWTVGGWRGCHRSGLVAEATGVVCSGGRTSCWAGIRPEDNFFIDLPGGK